MRSVNRRGATRSVELAESDSPKRKYLYVLGLEHPLKFFNGGRALSSVLSRNEKIQKMFEAKYGTNLTTVRDYYAIRKEVVVIQDVSSYLSSLLSVQAHPDEAEGFEG